MPWIELHAKWACVCRLCRDRIEFGESMRWHTGTKQVEHAKCPTVEAEELPKPNEAKRMYGMPLARLREWPKEKA